MLVELERDPSELETLFVPPIADLREVQCNRGVWFTAIHMGADLTGGRRPQHVIASCANVVDDLRCEMRGTRRSRDEPYPIGGVYDGREVSWLRLHIS